MKKLNKLVLNKARIMSAPQMKNITGGYEDSGSGRYICIITWPNGATDLGVCTGSSREWCEQNHGTLTGYGVSISCP